MSRPTPCLPSVGPNQCSCGAALPTRKDGIVSPFRVWCSATCSDAITAQHHWTWARAAALRRNVQSEMGPHCEGCDRPHIAISLAQRYGIERCDGLLEVNHKIPLVGAYRSWSCLNHAENLEVLCHGCHVKVTRVQRLERKGAASDLAAP